MNKKNLADLVIRQSEFKGEIGVAKRRHHPARRHLFALLGQRQA